MASACPETQSASVAAAEAHHDAVVDRVGLQPQLPRELEQRRDEVIPAPHVDDDLVGGEVPLRLDVERDAEVREAAVLCQQAERLVDPVAAAGLVRRLRDADTSWRSLVSTCVFVPGRGALKPR